MLFSISVTPRKLCEFQSQSLSKSLNYPLVKEATPARQIFQTEKTDETKNDRFEPSYFFLIFSLSI